MKLAKVIQTYVKFKRSMGMHFHSLLSGENLPTSAQIND